MKQKVMNIRPQEVTAGGERSVRYKGSDGKMHDFSAKLPQDAVIPVAHRTVIAAGETITLAQAHTIEGFDFNKVSAMSFGEGFNIYSGFYVNVDDSGERYLTYLEYAYPGKPRVMFNKEGSEYTAFNGSSYNTFLEFSSNDTDAAKSAIAEALLEIAKQTESLEIYNYSNYVFLPNFYEEVVLLTLAEDIVTSEEFFVESFTGDLLKLPTGSDSTAQDNVFIIQEGINQPVKKLIGYEEVDSSIDELHEALYNNPFGTKVVAVDHFYYHVMYLTEIDHANHTMDFDNVVFEFQCFDSMVIGNFVLRVQNGEKTLNVHMEN